ncbi:MAG: Cna B-type domain-containing protein, partial [Bacteroidales bacterium]|nr:Cna B-type domain-containing protein [Bacteroidales bacterium]
MAHIDTPDNPGYFTQTPDAQAFAVYSADDESLTFYSYWDVPEEGDTYKNKTVTAVYTGLENTGETNPPWEDVKKEIRTVSVHNSMAEVQPASFYRWFSGMTNCTSVDLTYLDTSGASVYTDMMTDMDALESLTIDANFTLFTESSAALVSQQNWYDADGVQLSDDYLIGMSGAGTYYTNPCQFGHHFDSPPVFTWAEDYFSCTATFTCVCGEEVETLACDVTREERASTATSDGAIIYTAACTFEGQDYTDVKTFETVSVSGSKIWDDANDQDGIRPGSVTVNLLADGDQADSATITSAEDWSFAFHDLLKYNENGEPITYTITEDAVENYTATVNGYDVTNSYTPQKTDISGTITWEDGNNQDGKRPHFIEAQLVAQDEDGGTLNFWNFEVRAPESPAYDGEGNEVWSWIEPDMDVYYDGGKEITYSVIYTGVDLTVYEQTNPNNFDAIYSYTPETTTISGSKIWVDNNDAELLRPESITIRLHANNELAGTQEVSAADGWTWSFDDLPVYADGQEITYAITEDAVDDYDTEYDDMDVTNTLSPGNTSVTVLADWEDKNDQDGIRPADLTVELLADGVATGQTLTLSAENGWEGSFKDLAVYSGGVRIVYTIGEVSVDRYTTEINGDASVGFTITNSYTPELLNSDGILTVTKAWSDDEDRDGVRPDSIYVHLLADGIAVDEAELSADENVDWTFVFADLPKYASGTEIEYTVEEVLDSAASATYTADYSGSVAEGLFITNTHTPELLNGDGILTVTKAWSDDEDRDGLRPAGVTVHLWADDEEIATATLGSETEKTGLWQSIKALFTGARTLAAEDEWTATFTDLPKYRDGGEVIIYTVTEDGVDEYETDVSGDAARGYTVTNTHTPETIALSGQKVWEDEENQDGKRPTYITIHLLADGDPALDEHGDAITEAVAGEGEDDWVWTFSDLPKYRDGGTEIEYTMEEDTTGLADIYTTETTGSMEEGFTITNSYTPELYNGDGTFKVVLVWDDEANNDGIRPTEVNVKLTKNDTTVEGAEMTLTANEVDGDGNWIGTFTGLPKYENGSEIKYSVKEDVKSGYTYRVELLTDESGNTYVQLTNVHVSVKEDIVVTKIWDDHDNQDGMRPESITLRLLTNGNLYKEKVLYANTEGVTVSENGDVWKYTMSDIPVDKNGETIEYTMLEVDVDDYGTPVIETIRGDEITDDGVTYQPYSFVVTNSHTPEQIDITGEKVWDDADDQDGKRPHYVTLHLYADGVKVSDMDVTVANDTDGDGDWEWAFTGWDKYKNGQEIEYTVEEEAVEEYDTTIDGDVEEGFTITNSYTPETTSISGKKTWVDDDNAANTRPDSITISLHANGSTVVDTKEVTAADNWSWEFDDLPVYQDGHKITYLITEDELDDYDGVYTFGGDGSYNVTNTLDSGETSVTVIKDWEDGEDQDGKRPESITVSLMRDGEVAKDHDGNEAVITLTEEGHWIGTFTKLDEYDGSGAKIEYTVQEVSTGVDGYESVITGDMQHGFVITNTHTPETVDLSGSKVWEDANDQDGLRPDYVTIHLLADGETVESKSVTADDNWAWTFENLDKYADGKEIAYSMEEVFVRDGYEVTPGDADNDYTFTNRHTPEKIDISGVKTWDDDNDRDEYRPGSIRIYLLADGETVEDADGNPVSTRVYEDEDGNWIYTFLDLDKYADGKEIQYSIREDVPNGYEASYTFFSYDVTDSHTPEMINGDGTLGVILRWDDEDDQDGLRPKRTTVTLTVNGEPDENTTLVLSDDNVDENGNWIGSFEDLYRYDQGETIAYNVEEGVMNGYTYTARLVYDSDTGLYYIEITNTHAAVTSDITVTKVWDDNDDQDGIRPDRVVVNLFSNGSAVKSVTITPGKEGVEVSGDGNEWSYTFADMPVDQNGAPIVYTLDEIDVGSYSHEIGTTTVEGNEKDGVTYTKYDFTVTNSHSPEMTEVSGEKIWDDADDQDGLRPHSITIELLADGVPALDENGEEITQVVTPHTDGSWTWTFTDIPKYRDGGTEIVYSFEEFAVEGYETSYSEDGRAITNTHEPETTTISGNKVWDDADDQDGKRPESITVNLYANGLVSDTRTVTAADNWEWTFADVPVYANGQKITYVTTEVAIDEYVTNYSGFTLMNSYEPGKTSVTVVADWEDAGNQDGLRPDSLSIELLADGAATGQTLLLTEDENGIWEGTFADLNEYKEGTRITYTIGEVSVDGYDCVREGDASEGFSLTFTHTPETVEVSGSKTWDDADDQDGLRPDEITIHLLANGEEVLTDEITPQQAGPLRKLGAFFTAGRFFSAEDDWSFAFTDLPKYENGQEITYAINEVAVTGYDVAITGDAENGFAITNTHTPETIAVSGTKIWNDADDQDGKRPASITLGLYADGKAATDENGDARTQLVTPHEDGSWGWTFADVPKYRDGGTEIAYTVEETLDEASAAAYTADYSGSMKEGYTITNTHEPELLNGDGTFRVVLVWDDEANNDGLRPEEVNIKLTKDNVAVEDAELTLTADMADSDGNWVGTFTDLPKYENGEEIAYSVKEDYLSGFAFRIERLPAEDGNAEVRLTNVHVSVTEAIEV